ncbi:hypothetical protein D7Y09_16020 [bacterium 1XD42-1]|nr:hypothetical protein D7X25_26705 [bacterium 1XD42-8]RKJ61314.1 hypothetical protein D7Y09_16020 [bacterium 1XD42-1]
MSSLFQNHAYSSCTYKHIKLPIYKTQEFNFYRCVNVKEWVYGKTISILHSGNLRDNDHKGRYSRLFPNEKISYWADSKETALAEIKKHNGTNDYLTFWAYDDASSTFPTLGINELLTIIDGRQLGFHSILKKIEQGKILTKAENETLLSIQNESPDCLAYSSYAKKDSMNFLFFEKGFKALALREVTLYLGERKSRNIKTVPCAMTCDYSPILQGYGYYFEPIARAKFDNNYMESEEYQFRLNNYKKYNYEQSDNK